MTELTWTGKYLDGKKVSPVRIALPFQTIETVNESSADRQARLNSLFANESKQTTEWRNRLIWGDKKYVLPSLLPEFAGKVKLIYIDPPFDTGANFSFTAQIPTYQGEDSTIAGDSFTKEPNMMEVKAYRDTWGRGLDSYLQWFYETVSLLRDLLAEDGSIYVHLDWHVSHYAKAILDEVFGYDNFLNEIVWKRRSGRTSPDASIFEVVTESIYWYGKTSNYCFNPIYTKEGTEEYINERFIYSDEKGRRYRLSPLNSPKPRPNLMYEYKGYLPHKNGWSVSKETMEKYDAEGKLYFPKLKNQRIQRKQYLDEWEGRLLQNLWNDIPPINPMAQERVNYATQKPEALLERILKASSNEGDLVLDCFCGSGTTAATAEKLGRKWITCDLGRFAIHTARKRLLGIEGVKPFVVQNLGKYERQQWQQQEFQQYNTTADYATIHENYLTMLLDLYHATRIKGYTWLHGSKAGRMVHIGSIDAPVTVTDVQAIVREFWQIMGKEQNMKVNGVDILGWEFAFELNETAKQFANDNKVELKFKKIPREVLEKKAIEQGDIKFFEMAALDLTIKVNARTQEAKIELSSFIIPPDDVPQDIRGKIGHWSQWIDYWAIDWDYKDDSFHNEWQAYRTRQVSKLPLSAEHQYANKGKYQVVIKVIDILGNDTTKMVEIIV